MATAMNLRFKISLLVSLFLLMFLLSPPGTVEGFGIGVNQVDTLHKGCQLGGVHVHVNSRKMLKFDATLDYDYAGPNQKHDQRGRRGGNGGKNP